MAGTKLASASVVISAPLSFAGSAQRIWKVTNRPHPVVRGVMLAVALILIPLAWVVVLSWYAVVGVLVVPYRLVRRGERRRTRDEMELLEMRRARFTAC